MLPGLHAYPTLDSHHVRYAEAGFSSYSGCTMREFFNNLPESEQTRIKKLEIFDEIEEWELMGDHYCITWAWNKPSVFPQSFLFKR